MDLGTGLLLAAGLLALVGGGEVLVRGSSGLASALGLSPLVVGLTVVAFATSAPELAVTLDATLRGTPALAVGNVVGSNIANVLLVLGLSAVLLPLAVRAQLVRLDVPVALGLSVLALLLALDGAVSRTDGLLLVALLAAYVTLTVRTSRRASRRAQPSPEEGPRAEEPAGGRRRLLADGLRVVAGVGLLVLGARALVTGAVEVAAAAGISDLVVGLTVVAVGTSLPELATSVIAAVRGQREMAVGNVVGSNAFNLGAVLGLAAGLSPGGVPVDAAAVRFDLPVMVAVALLLLPLAYTGSSIARWEGLLLLGYYAVYVGYLLLASAEHDAVGPLSTVLAAFVLPLTGLLLALLVAREARRRRTRAGAPGAVPS